MSVRFEVEPGWQRHLDGPIAELLERLGSEIVEDAKDLAPVDTGHLRESIGHTVTGEGFESTLTVEASADYAGYVELGTRYMAPQPFLRPALYRHRGA
jgi:HK97 gp10 family phage protein